MLSRRFGGAFSDGLGCRVSGVCSCNTLGVGSGDYGFGASSPVVTVFGFTWLKLLEMQIRPFSSSGLAKAKSNTCLHVVA